MAKEQMTTTDILRELEPTVEAGLNRHLRTAQEWFPHDYIPWEQGRNFARLGGEDWDPSQSELPDHVKSAMYVGLLTEDNLPSYHREIAENFGRDGAWGTWVNRWTAEENRHGIAMRDLLVVTRSIDPVELERARMNHMSAGYESGDRSPIHVLAYVAIQELATQVAHRNTGKQSGNDIADHLMQRIAKDEAMHGAFYSSLVEQGLRIAPDQMMRAVTDEFRGFRMPGATMPNFNPNAKEIAINGIYDPVLHSEAVVDKLLGRWKPDSVEGLTGDGAKALEELGLAVESLRRKAGRFAEFRDQELERRAELQQAS